MDKISEIQAFVSTQVMTTPIYKRRSIVLELIDLCHQITPSELKDARQAIIDADRAHQNAIREVLDLIREDARGMKS